MGRRASMTRNTKYVVPPICARGSVGDADHQSYVTLSTYDYQGCFSDNYGNDLVQVGAGTITNFEACLQATDDQANAVAYVDGGDFDCYYKPSTLAAPVDDANCGGTGFFYYTHTPVAGPQKSGTLTYGRRAALNRYRRQMKKLACPMGLTACLVEGSSDSYEVSANK